MLKLRILLITLLLSIGTGTMLAGNTGEELPTVKKERNHICSGNKLYKAKRYAEAEVEYRKALQVAPSSAIAQFNLATALMRQGNATASQDSHDNPMSEAQAIFENLAKNCPNRDLRGKASYDLGNIAYAQQQWAQAIEHYKNALRCNPNDDHARDNLRLAQLKKQQQDQNKNQNKNQDQNKDQDKQDKNQNKDQNKDQQHKDQDKQDQDKQNQDKQNQQNQDKQDQQQSQGQPKQQNGMSQQNAEQVLKAMQDQERATQQRINAQKAQQRRGERARTNRKW